MRSGVGEEPEAFEVRGRSGRRRGRRRGDARRLDG
jgi:hypothetical protein